MQFYILIAAGHGNMTSVENLNFLRSYMVYDDKRFRIPNESTVVAAWAN